MNRDFNTVLDECLTWVSQGVDLATCLERYPHHARELRPLLEMVPYLSRAHPPLPSHTAYSDGEQRMLAALEERRVQHARRPAIFRWAMGWLRRVSLRRGAPGRTAPAWRAAVAILGLFLLVAGSTTAMASMASLPGDVLYSAKLLQQRIHLALTFDPVREQVLQDQFQNQRRLDVQAGLRGGRLATVDFQGDLQAMEDSIWNVGGLPVTILDSTRVHGVPALGAHVNVDGRLLGDGALVATEIEIQVTPASDSSETEAETPVPTVTELPSVTSAPTGTLLPNTVPSATHTPEPSPTATPSAAPTVAAPTSSTPTPEATATDSPVNGEPGPATTTESHEEQESGDNTQSVETRAPEATGFGEMSRTVQPPGKTEEPHQENTPKPTKTPQVDDDDRNDD